MSEILLKNQVMCPTDDIAAYIDGELDTANELRLESHFSGCRICSDELNDQKQFLCNLNASLQEESEIELPADFARHIVTSAESAVSGLRPARERYNAVFICCGLFLFVIFAMGAEAGKLVAGFYLFVEQSMAVGSFFGQVLYSVFVGLVIVLRSFANQFRFDVVAGLAIAAGLGIAVLFLSRRLVRLRRV